MAKITFIGAGSAVFTRNLVSDILLVPAFHDATLSLMDIDPHRLDLAHKMVHHVVDVRRLPRVKVEVTTDRRAALKDADYAICTIQVGGLDAYQYDIEIPLKYGVGQCVGDTLGPGGVFRGLRTIPVLLDIVRDMEEVSRPDALLLNYSNPMAINSWAVLEATGHPYVGLCHSVQGTSEMLAEWIGAPYDEVNFVCAGINHQAWFLEFRWNGEDAMPLIREAIKKPENIAVEPVRTELMEHFGYFVTESSGHASEYLPYFRKNTEMIENELVPRFANDQDGWFDWGRSGGYLRECLRRAHEYEEELEEMLAGRRTIPTRRSREYCSYILEAIETNKPIVINGNVANTGLITNLSQGSCVEVPCLVDRNGIQPLYVGDLPPQLAAINRTNINVQELAVQGGLTGDRDMIHYAIALDPLTAAVCTLPQIHQMVDELFEAEAQWLPQFTEGDHQ
ncbi:MAG TPA: alpha-glucosidase/alpha-galactosidase [Anaerolineae bacterium]|nr:alpha-glucosidase/alpha-galactosidase [Anaerolineae bacterium]HIQ04117.1 alpha-glucosidase/alpha-galactosidase [Anaerolineae bacterium]